MPASATAVDAAQLDLLVGSMVGQRARWRRYDRARGNAMNLVLDCAQERLSRPFVVYWVDGGLPEHFTLPGFDPVPVVFNSRVVEIGSFFRKLMVDSFLAPVREELSERTCLRIMAELSLRYGDRDLAVLAFLRSIVGQSFFVPTNDLLLSLELETVNEAYLAGWFFGLAHELGHVYDWPPKVPPTAPWSDEHIRRSLDAALKRLPRSAPARKLAPRAPTLQIERLRDEAAADVFALGVLLQVADSLQRKRGDVLRLDVFVGEMLTYHHIIVLAERCKRAAQIAVRPRDADLELEVSLHPLTFDVRKDASCAYLTEMTALLAAGEDPPPRRMLKKAERMVEGIKAYLRGGTEVMDRGLAKAMRFMLDPAERDRSLFDQFARELASPSNLMHLLELRKFCELADTLSLDSRNLAELRRLRDQHDPLHRKRDVEGPRRYVVPWVSGPRVDMPLVLSTRDGNVLFVFPDQESWESWSSLLSDVVRREDTLALRTFEANSDAQLRETLAKRFPADFRFDVVHEGTPQFVRSLEQLVRRPLWQGDGRWGGE